MWNVCVFFTIKCLEFSLMNSWNKETDEDQLEGSLLTNNRQN